MGKILAIVFLLLFILIAIPHIARGEWIAPAAIASDSWLINSPYDTGLATASASPVEGYGWFHFDFWKHDPATPGRVVTKSDFRLRL